MQRVYEPQPVSVRKGASGLPIMVGRQAVQAINEDWVIEDYWWAETALRRRYFEVILENGRNMVIFFDLDTRQWFNQRD
jgi:hypothetical protein